MKRLLQEKIFGIRVGEHRIRANRERSRVKGGSGRHRQRGCCGGMKYIKYIKKVYSVDRKDKCVIIIWQEQGRKWDGKSKRRGKGYGISDGS